MIPKIIHYCWFGRKPLPSLAVKCIDSWKKFLPDYEIKEWNEDNFDVNIVPYTREAYNAKKYAFVSDYARFWIIYHYGGVYFDTDVEVIRPMGEIIKRGAFMGIENSALSNEWCILKVAPGLGIGSLPNHILYEEILKMYDNQRFILPNGQFNLKTVVDYTTELFLNHGLGSENGIQNVCGIYIYPRDYFNPKDPYTGDISITANTYSIHHFSMSWVPKNRICLTKVKKILMRLLGVENVEKIISLFKLKELRERIK